MLFFLFLVKLCVGYNADDSFLLGAKSDLCENSTDCSDESCRHNYEYESDEDSLCVEDECFTIPEANCTEDCVFIDTHCESKHECAYTADTGNHTCRDGCIVNVDSNLFECVPDPCAMNKNLAACKLPNCIWTSGATCRDLCQHPTDTTKCADSCVKNSHGHCVPNPCTDGSGSADQCHALLVCAFINGSCIYNNCSDIVPAAASLFGCPQAKLGCEYNPKHGNCVYDRCYRGYASDDVCESPENPHCKLRNDPTGSSAAGRVGELCVFEPPNRCGESADCSEAGCRHNYDYNKANGTTGGSIDGEEEETTAPNGTANETDDGKGDDKGDDKGDGKGDEDKDFCVHDECFQFKTTEACSAGGGGGASTPAKTPCMFVDGHCRSVAAECAYTADAAKSTCIEACSVNASADAFECIPDTCAQYTDASRCGTANCSFNGLKCRSGDMCANITSSSGCTDKCTWRFGICLPTSCTLFPTAAVCSINKPDGDGNKNPKKSSGLPLWAIIVIIVGAVLLVVVVVGIIVCVVAHNNNNQKKVVTDSSSSRRPLVPINEGLLEAQVESDEYSNDNTNGSGDGNGNGYGINGNSYGNRYGNSHGNNSNRNGMTAMTSPPPPSSPSRKKRKGSSSPSSHRSKSHSENGKDSSRSSRSGSDTSGHEHGHGPKKKKHHGSSSKHGSSSSSPSAKHGHGHGHSHGHGSKHGSTPKQEERSRHGSKHRSKHGSKHGSKHKSKH